MSDSRELLTDMLDAMLGAASAVTEANRREQRLRPLEDQIAALERQIFTLQQTVATMASVLASSGALGATERRQILDAARTARRATLEEAPADETAAVATAYRGLAPSGGAACGVCGKAFAADDPELTLGSHGRVCALCFTRGG
ncbi:MAG TPA: hypothetical protein VIF62_36575 [Labilithrix sp.]|jgi:hypothetical protein